MTEQPEIASSFYRIPFQKHTRLELLTDLRVRAPDHRDLQNHLGTMHGGMIYALGEVAAAVSMAQLLERDRAGLHAITRRGVIDYLKPARGAITAACTVSMTRDAILSAVDAQRSVDVPIVVTLSDDANLVVARLDVVWYVARRR